MTADRTLAPCGTEAAYRRHRRHGEAPCQECRRAEAAAQRRRRGVGEQVDTPMRELVTDLPGTRSGVLDFTAELGLLFGVLSTALDSAAPREAASIAREMRGILHDLRAEENAARGPSLKEQLAEAKRERAARLEARKLDVLARGDVDGLSGD